SSYDRLTVLLEKVQQKEGTRGNCLFYLATHASDFPEIVAQLGRVGLDHEMHGGGWRRVIIEKPFGRDLDSATRLNREVLKVFRAIPPPPKTQVMRDVVRGQYGRGWVAAEEVPGYRQEPDVDPHSETETFIAARFEIDDWRWADVPFYLRTGKRLPKRASE